MRARPYGPARFFVPALKKVQYAATEIAGLIRQEPLDFPALGLAVGAIVWLNDGSIKTAVIAGSAAALLAPAVVFKKALDFAPQN